MGMVERTLSRKERMSKETGWGRRRVKYWTGLTRSGTEGDRRSGVDRVE